MSEAFDFLHIHESKAKHTPAVLHDHGGKRKDSCRDCKLYKFNFG